MRAGTGNRRKTAKRLRTVDASFEGFEARAYGEAHAALTRLVAETVAATGALVEGGLALFTSERGVLTENAASPGEYAARSAPWACRQAGAQVPGAPAPAGERLSEDREARIP